MKTLQIAGEVFDALAAGDGAIVGPLRSGLRSKRLLLLHEMFTTAKARASDVFREAQADEAFAVLVAAQGHDRSAADAVMLQPHVGAWAMTCLRKLLSDEPLPPEDIGHLGGVAAAAAIRAGYPFEVTAYVRDHSVMLPTYGAAVVPDPDSWCRLRGGPDAARAGVEIRGPGGTYTAPVGADHDTETWRRLRRLRAPSADGPTFDVPLEDLDPYRNCGHLPVADRLEEATFAAWQQTLEAAWPLLVDDDPERANALVMGVTSIVPLVATESAAELSASCHDAVGAVAMTQPVNVLGLALALVHEHQHNKLSALLDLVPLLTPSTDARYRAPWRPDPRPLRGLIHGTYAFFGLTRFWESVRRRSEVWDPEAAEDWAHFEYALGLRQVEFAVQTLIASGHLNEHGERFVHRMRQEVAALRALDDIPPAAERSADLVAADHAAAWRLRNCRPIGRLVDDWAEALAKGKRCAWPNAPQVEVIDGGERIASAARQTLVRHRLAHPDSWQQRVADASAADVALVTGDPALAAELYEKQIDMDPDDHASWAGLALAQRDAEPVAAWALSSHPELVLALHGAVLNETGSAPSATRIANWLGRSAPNSTSTSAPVGRRWRNAYLARFLGFADRRIRQSPKLDPIRHCWHRRMRKRSAV